MEKLILEFYECEHDGDLNYYIGDITDCGGKYLSGRVDHDREIGWVTVEVKDKREFWNKFKQTDAYGFLN